MELEKHRDATEVVLVSIHNRYLHSTQWPVARAPLYIEIQSMPETGTRINLLL